MRRLRNARLARCLFWIFRSGPVPAAEARRKLGNHLMPSLVAKGYIEVTRSGRKVTYSITERGIRRLEIEVRKAGKGGENA